MPASTVIFKGLVNKLLEYASYLFVEYVINFVDNKAWRQTSILMIVVSIILRECNVECWERFKVIIIHVHRVNVSLHVTVNCVVRVLIEYIDWWYSHSGICFYLFTLNIKIVLRMQVFKYLNSYNKCHLAIAIAIRNISHSIDFNYYIIHTTTQHKIIN